LHGNWPIGHDKAGRGNFVDDLAEATQDRLDGLQLLMTWLGEDHNVDLNCLENSHTIGPN
jgi:hypothetical protein